MGHANYIVLLIKFVREREHAQTFVAGNLFCRPWSSFRNSEEMQRGDRLELVASKLQTEVHLTGLGVNRSYSFWLEEGDNQFAPVFCMYQLSSGKQVSSMKVHLKDDRLKEFGNYGVVVTNTGKFIERINRNLPGFSYGLIDYINFGDLRNKSAFFKTPILKKDYKAFRHQREFRMYNTNYAITNNKNIDNPNIEIIQPNEFDASFFSIGDLSDFTEIHSMDELFSGVEINIQNPMSKSRMNKELWWDGEKYQKIE
jgi:hypothetical protein